jgi:hypothetical protein
MLSASGFGTKVSALAGIVESDRTAPSGFGCTRKVPIDHSNNVAEVDLGALGVVGAVTTHNTSSKVGKVIMTESTTTIADASLLSGAVVIEGLEVIARTYHDPDGFHAETEASAVTITIGGESYDILEGEQEITIPGIAKVVLNGSDTTEKANLAKASVGGLKITLRAGDGATIIVGSAAAGIDGRTYEGTFAGGGYGTTIEIAGTVESGKTANKSLPCLGTNGVDRTNSTADADAGVVEIGAIQTTVNGDATVPEATVTNEVADVTVDLGLAELRIEGVVTEVHVIENEDGTVSADIGDSGVASIVVEPLIGPPIEIPIDVEPGTEIVLPLGLGTIKFFDITEYKGDRGIGLIGLQIDLPLIDTNVTVGSVRAAIKG